MTNTNLKALEKIRNEANNYISHRKIIADRVNIVVGMGKSGIKAGAKNVLHTFLEEFRKREMYDVILRQVGVEEEYGVEPVVMVHIPGMGSVKYREVTPEIAIEIIDKHILKNEILNDFVHRMPFEMNG